MNRFAEMILTDYFKLSTGHFALVGRMTPDVKELINKCKADLFIGNKKNRSINIVG